MLILKESIRINIELELIRIKETVIRMKEKKVECENACEI